MTKEIYERAAEVLGPGRDVHDQIIKLMHTFAKLYPDTLGRDVVKIFVEKHDAYIQRWMDLVKERSDKR